MRYVEHLQIIAGRCKTEKRKEILVKVIQWKRADATLSVEKLKVS